MIVGTVCSLLVRLGMIAILIADMTVLFFFTMKGSIHGYTTELLLAIIISTQLVIMVMVTYPYFREEKK